MNRSQFFKHFDLLADQPDAVAKMRELVMQLAIQGRFNTQSSADSLVPLALPPSDISIDDARERDEDDDQDNSSLDVADEYPYELPPKWRWFRLGELASFIGGSQPPKSKFIFEPKPGYTRLVQIRDFKSNAHTTY